MVMNAEQFNQRMKKVAEYSNKGEMNLVSLRVMLYLTNEYDVSKKDTIVQSAEAIGANIGGYSYPMIRKGLKQLRDKDILIEKRCSFDRRYYEYKFNEIEQWKE
jgi:DNA-binding transcriptional ArsR family regulator